MAKRGKEPVAFTAPTHLEGEPAEDEDTQRLVAAFQEGDREAFGGIYTRYFERVYGYMRVAFKEWHDAEDAAQQVFALALAALPSYERRVQPFRHWLFKIVRNHALGEIRKLARLEVVDPAELDELREAEAQDVVQDETVDDAAGLNALNWIGDPDLFLFAERLPFAQRQVIVLRYTLGLTDREIAKVMHRTPVDVRTLQHRALRFLEKRLDAIGRGPIKDIPGASTDQAQWQRRLRQAPVLRERRFQISEKRPGDRDPRY